MPIEAFKKWITTVGAALSVSAILGLLGFTISNAVFRNQVVNDLKAQDVKVQTNRELIMEVRAKDIAAIDQRLSASEVSVRSSLQAAVADIHNRLGDISQRATSYKNDSETKIQSINDKLNAIHQDLVRIKADIEHIEEQMKKNHGSTN